jgi:hypothetical protein
LPFVEALLLDLLPAKLVTNIPTPIMYALNLPGAIYCYYLVSTEPIPNDDIPLFQAAQGIHCYFVGLVLDIPYFFFLILIGWWLIDKWRSKPIAATEPG